MCAPGRHGTTRPEFVARRSVLHTLTKGDEMEPSGGRVLLVWLSVCVALIGCTGGGSTPQKPQTAEQVCAPDSVGNGPGYYCGTAQNLIGLQRFPDGNVGVCALPANSGQSAVG